MLFASLVLEREPTKWSDLPAGTHTWLMDVGMLAAVVLFVGVIVLAVRLVQRPTGTRSQPGGIPPALFFLCAAVTALAYLVAALGWLMGREGDVLRVLGKTIGGLSALLAVALPFLVNVVRLRGRRIWALAVVSFKEAVRRRILWLFAFIMVFFLFFSWFIDSKPENQVRDYVGAISLAMAVLLLIPAALLGAFGLPADMTNQTIHTIITKPVERFEIYLGRVLGYIMVMSLVLFGMTGFSLVLLARSVNPEAHWESWRARVPLFGDLTLEPKGENLSVGREWDYRKYIAGGDAIHRAIWAYSGLPADLASRAEPVQCEYAFDIFRTTKGDEKLGVLCTFEFHSGQIGPTEIAEYSKERARLLDERGGDLTAQQKIDEELAAKYGYYELKHKQIVDYHTETIAVPVGVFKHALANDPPPDPEQAGKPGPRLRVVVKCESRTQYVGMAKRDLYLLNAERSPSLNFFKGASGLWLLLCLVISVAVACSTQLSGVISFLATSFLFIAGMFQEYVVSLAEGVVEGGGPAQATYRLLRGIPSPTIPLEESPGRSLAEGADLLYRGLFRFLKMIVPDVNAYDMTEYVAEGFDVALLNFGGDDLLVKALLLLAYLVPWGLCAYYLLRWREVAA